MRSLDLVLLAEAAYLLLVIAVCVRVIYDTRSTAKTLAYLLFVVFVPVVGIVVYFAVGINYRKRSLYSRKLIGDAQLMAQLRDHLLDMSRATMADRPALAPVLGLVRLLLHDARSPLTGDNTARLLVNGEEKFPALFEAMEQARHHIHLEYYIWERGMLADRLLELLARKVREGVQVRVIYDDYGSRSIRRGYVRALRAAGVEAFPFNKVRLFANRINYRNHRKLVVIDGRTAFIGGINISDRYVNAGEGTYWRDTHLMLAGSSAWQLQYLFLCDWNFCSGQQIGMGPDLFPRAAPAAGDVGVQVAASGPDSPTPTILLSLIRAITAAREELLITTPYFIPGEAIIEALRVAALGGVRVRLLVPGRSDSWLVNAAAWSFYNEMLAAGVEIHLYQRGFIHSKTLVVDGLVSMVGTANMDQRSFELNFEVNAVLYSSEVAQELRTQFERDLAHAEQIDPQRWAVRPWYKQFPEQLARLAAPLL